VLHGGLGLFRLRHLEEPLTPFTGIPDLLLSPLAGRGDDAWFRAPPGKWNAAQIVDHLTIAIEGSAATFASRADKPAMMRRPRALPQVLAWRWVASTGYFGLPRRAPETTLPAVAPDRAATEARLRAGVQAFLGLERELLPRRALDLFVKHPVFGDLTLPEFMTFHVRHAEHHARQVRSLVA
jgi:hypothetical protein